MKYLTLIRAITLLHQHQRPIKTVVHNGRTIPYIESTPSDIEAANALASETLGRSLDELAPQTRRLLDLVVEMVACEGKRREIAREDLRFTRKDVRDYTGWSDAQLKRHLARLEDMEYLISHHGGRGRLFVYELVYGGEGAAGRPFMMGLIDVDGLSDRPAMSTYTEKKYGVNGNKYGANGEKYGGGTPQVRAMAKGSTDRKSALSSNSANGSDRSLLDPLKSHSRGEGPNVSSYTDGARSSRSARGDVA